MTDVKLSEPSILEAACTTDATKACGIGSVPVGDVGLLKSTPAIEPCHSLTEGRATLADWLQSKPFPSPFFRMSFDGRRLPLTGVDGLALSRYEAACVIIGAGPSAKAEDLRMLQTSGVPTFAINMGGVVGQERCLWPTYWTAYDGVEKFDRSLYMNPGVLKFMHFGRGGERVADLDCKACECPATIMFDHEKRDYESWVRLDSDKIVDATDTMCYAIDIAIRLGYRRLYFYGCDMRVRPTEAQVAAAVAMGVKYDGDVVSYPDPKDNKMTECHSNRLIHLLQECERKGLKERELVAMGTVERYSFKERASLRMASSADEHYWKVARYLRAALPSFAAHGVTLTSCTSLSRLNTFMRHLPISDTVSEIQRGMLHGLDRPIDSRYMLVTSHGSRMLHEEDVPSPLSEQLKVEAAVRRANAEDKREWPWLAEALELLRRPLAEVWI